MSRRTVLGLLVPLLVILHFLFHVGFSIASGAPDLLTLALLLAARELSLGWGGGLGFFLGLLEDAFSVLAFGASAFALTLVGILGARTRDLFVGDSLLFFFVYLTVGKLLRNLVYWVVAGATVRGPFLESMVIQGGLASVYMAAVGVLVVVVLGGGRAIR